MNDLQFVAAEDTEHLGACALQQPPEAALLDRLTQPDPTGFPQRGKKCRNAFRVRQPLVDAQAGDAAVIRMGTTPGGTLVLENTHHFMPDVEAVDQCIGAGSNIAQLAAAKHTAPEITCVAEPRQGVHHRLAGTTCVAGVAVVHRHMEREVVRIQAKLIQLVGRDQQVQRQLFVAQVESNDFRQELLGVPTQCELNQALDVEAVVQIVYCIQAVARQEISVQNDMILVRHPLAQLFDIGADQVGEFGVAPVSDQPIQPRAIDQFRRRSRAQKIQRVGPVGEIAARRSGLALFQIDAVLGRDSLGIAFHPEAEIFRGFRQVASRRFDASQLLQQKNRCFATG